MQSNGYSTHSPVEMWNDLSHPDWEVLRRAYAEAQDKYTDPLVYFTSRVELILEEMKKFLKTDRL